MRISTYLLNLENVTDYNYFSYEIMTYDEILDESSRVKGDCLPCVVSEFAMGDAGTVIGNDHFRLSDWVDSGHCRTSIQRVFPVSHGPKNGGAVRKSLSYKVLGSFNDGWLVIAQKGIGRLFNAE